MYVHLLLNYKIHAGNNHKVLPVEQNTIRLHANRNVTKTDRATRSRKQCKKDVLSIATHLTRTLIKRAHFSFQYNRYLEFCWYCVRCACYVREKVFYAFCTEELLSCCWKLTTSIICISVRPKLNTRGSDSLPTGRSSTLYVSSRSLSSRFSWEPPFTSPDQLSFFQSSLYKHDL